MADGTSTLGLDSELLQQAGPIFDRLRDLSWPARRPAAADLPGAHQSRRRGAALEFTEYRPYRQGDDPRRLDWRLLARTDRAYVRITDERALRPTLIIVDGSASMAFPPRSFAKWQSAQLLALAAAFIAHNHGDPVGLAIAADRRIQIGLRNRRSALAEFAAALAGSKPTGSGALAPLLHDIRRGGRARAVIVSDCLGDAPSVLEQARVLQAAGTDCYAIHLVSPEELSPPAQASVVSDPEDGTIRRTLTRANRAAYVANFASWRSALRDNWRSAGMAYIEASTDEATERLVRRLVQSGGSRA
jgi:uncharacterized protein (DUF58 family)